MTQLEKYYNKFKEDHRLTTRHGRVEFEVSMKYILECADKMDGGFDRLNHRDSGLNHRDSGLNHRDSGLDQCDSELNNRDYSGIKIADIGAGTGRYSVALARMGFDVTAVELVKHNLEILEGKHERVKCWPGDARDLSFLPDETFDVTLLFGPMYHLHGMEERLKALNEAKRITKKGGYILVAYVMNEYAVISYCFKQGKIKECLKTLTEDFHTITEENKDLYSYTRLEDMNQLNEAAGLERVKVFAPDGAADFMRRELNALDEESFELFIKYQMAVCERADLIGASSHTVDVLIRN